MSDPTAWWVGFSIGAVVGSLLVGVLLGLVPLILGQYVGEAKFGRLGFLLSVVAGFIAGAIGAVPVSIGFAVAIILRWRRAKANVTSSSDA